MTCMVFSQTSMTISFSLPSISGCLYFIPRASRHVAITRRMLTSSAEAPVAVTIPSFVAIRTTNSSSIDQMCSKASQQLAPFPNTMSIWMFLFCFFALEHGFAQGTGRGFIATASAEELELHFVLIHGASHGAWAWYRLEDAMQKAGFNVSSVDMAGAGINPADPNSVATWEEYDKPAIDLFESLPERAPHWKVVLVGHSFGGLSTLLLMERFPHKIDLAIFVAALVLPSGVVYQNIDVTLLSLMNNIAIYSYLNGTNNPPTSFYHPLSVLGSVIYSGLDSEITVLGSKLLRPQPARMLGTPINYTTENHGRVPAVYIRYMDDKVLPPVAQEYIVTHYGPFRKVVKLSGGHFNFLQRPKEFTKLLSKLANQYT